MTGNSKLTYALYMLADTARHYLPVKIIKGVIDAMTYSKLVGLMAIQF